MSKIEKTHIRYAPLSRRIVIARFGKDDEVALETKDAMSNFLQVAVQYAFDSHVPPEPGEEAEVKFGAGEEQFIMTIKRVAA